MFQDASKGAPKFEKYENKLSLNWAEHQLPSTTQHQSIGTATTSHFKTSPDPIHHPKRFNTSPNCHHQPYLINIKLVHYFPGWMGGNYQKKKG